MQQTTEVNAEAAMGRLATVTTVGGPELSLNGTILEFGGRRAEDLAAQFGTPLYLYSERILRTRCRELASFLKYRPFIANYSCKANTNVAVLKVVREEGLSADAMSPGEILLLKTAGFPADRIFYVGNNVDDKELLYAITEGVVVSVDSLAQLERYGRINPGGKVAVRINPGIGDGHHRKVVTGGADAKFGIYYTLVPEIKEIIAKYNLRLIGLNQHIGSNFLSGETYLASVNRILSIGEQFDDLDFIDFGGGFGIPYTNEGRRLDLGVLGDRISDILESWTAKYGKRITAKIEPGRYVVAESGILLIKVHSVKDNPGFRFVGTDGGFNVLARPVMYGSYHEIINTRLAGAPPIDDVNICGNICESGDLLCQDRPMPEILEGDILGVLDAGAYGASMSSNYNARLRPAEVMLTMDGNIRLVRERDTLDDLLRHQVY